MKYVCIYKPEGSPAQLCAIEKALTDDEREDELERAKMANERPVLEFIPPALFEWNEQKGELNQAKHGIDFEDAVDIFYGPVILRQSNRNNEERWIALGYLDDRLIAVVFTRRTDVIRIISARRAGKNEEREYRNAEMGRSPERQD